MKTEINKLPQSEIELMIEVPPDEWREFLDETAKELSLDLKIEGFRPGHAPISLVEEKIGTARLLEEAAEHCVQRCYVRAILDKNIEAIGKPEISILKIAKDNPFEFKAKVAVMPDVALPDYKKIAQKLKKDKKEIKVSEDEIEKSLEWLQRSRTKYATVNRPAQTGDRVEVDFEGILNGQKLKELASKEQPAILGKGYFIPGFEKHLEGMKEGEEKEFELLFPDNFQPQSLAAKLVNFKVKMNLVQESQLPDLDDSFAQGIGHFKDMSELKKSIKDGLVLEKAEQEKEKQRLTLIKEIADSSLMDVPLVLKESETKRTMDELRLKIEELRVDYKTYLEKIGKAEVDLKKEIEEKSEEKIKGYLVLREIAKKEKIAPSEEEITEEMDKVIKRFGAPDQVNNNIDMGQLRSYTEDTLKNEKTFQFLENC